LEELAKVLARRKFDKYLEARDRVRFFELLAPVAIRIVITRPVVACRDAKDDKFLALAVNGNADAIITGDADLLTLHPFLSIPILTPKEFLGREWPERQNGL
jgi:putative PIN family toxin of toxin-antitoxin system